MVVTGGGSPDWTMVGVLTGVALGVPGWVVSLYAMRSTRRAQRAAEIGEVVKNILAGHHSDDPLDPDHPSFRDLLTEIRDNTSELSWMSAVLAFHLSDDHGPQQPTLLRNKPHPDGGHR